MSLPLVSVCMPTRNGAEFIGETLNCVFRQTYRPLELIVSDDASSDATLQIIAEATKDHDITVKIFHHQPSGIGANWNHCVRNASGKYIKFLFQDDLIYPDCIAEMVALSEKDEEIGLTFCNRDIIGDLEGKTDWLNRYENLSGKWNEIKPIQEGRALLKQPDFLKSPRNKIGEATVVLLKRQCFSDVGFFSEELKQTLDYEYWYRVLPKYKIGYINRNLAAFRLHKNQATQKNLTGMNEEYLICYKSIHKSVYQYLSPSNKIRILSRLIKFTFRQKRLKLMAN